LPEIRSDRPTRFQLRRCAQMLVRTAVAALCIQMLTDCARRPIGLDSIAGGAPIRSKAPIPLRRPPLPQSRPRSDCFKTSGLGDTWLDTQEAAPRNCMTTDRATGTSK
jgi:hypothetical protein